MIVPARLLLKSYSVAVVMKCSFNFLTDLEAAQSAVEQLVGITGMK